MLEVAGWKVYWILKLILKAIFFELFIIIIISFFSKVNVFRKQWKNLTI